MLDDERCDILTAQDENETGKDTCKRHNLPRDDTSWQCACNDERCDILTAPNDNKTGTHTYTHK